jgi:hypothetical protein
MKYQALTKVGMAPQKMAAFIRTALIFTITNP